LKIRKPKKKIKVNFIQDCFYWRIHEGFAAHILQRSALKNKKPKKKSEVNFAFFLGFLFYS